MENKEHYLEKLAALLEDRGIRKHTCINGMGYSQIERDIVDLFTETPKTMAHTKNIETFELNGYSITVDKNALIKAGDIAYSVDIECYPVSDNDDDIENANLNHWKVIKSEKLKTMEETKWFTKSENDKLAKQTKHTPLQWVKRQSTRKIGTFEICTAEPEPTTIALLPSDREKDFTGHASHSESEANAELICRAVNSHHILIEALEYTRKRILFLEQYTEGKCDPTPLENISQLLKQVKE